MESESLCLWWLSAVQLIAGGFLCYLVSSISAKGILIIYYSKHDFNGFIGFYHLYTLQIVLWKANWRYLSFSLFYIYKSIIYTFFIRIFIFSEYIIQIENFQPICVSLLTILIYLITLPQKKYSNMHSHQQLLIESIFLKCNQHWLWSYF